MKKLFLLLPMVLICAGCAYVKGVGWMSSPSIQIFPEQLGSAYGTTWSEIRTDKSIENFTISTDKLVTMLIDRTEYLQNKSTGEKFDYGDHVLFPQKDGSFKAMGKVPRTVLNKYRGMVYQSIPIVRIKNDKLVILISLLDYRPDRDDTDYHLYTDCAHHTQDGAIKYPELLKDWPVNYYGEFDPKTNNFYITSSERLDYVNKPHNKPYNVVYDPLVCK